MRTAVAAKLVGNRELFMRYQDRDALRDVYLDPVPDASGGDVVLLVDELSASSSEESAGSLQALGRATIFGAQTPGSCLVLNIVPLPAGAILACPYARPQTADGRVLEGNGVVPDIAVALDRSGSWPGSICNSRQRSSTSLEPRPARRSWACGRQSGR